MNKVSATKSPKFNILGVLSPVVGVPSALILHELLGFTDHTHGMTSLFMALEIMLYFFIAGVAFSIISFVRGEKFIIIGMLALILNAAPALFLLLQT